MAYSIDLIYSKNQDYSNPQTVTEAGQPSSIDLENLDSNQTYYTKAVLKNDGIVEDEDTNTFTTLPAGTIALTHQSSTRQGSNYVVVYTYTSTYALSSSILRCGTTISAQGVISGNTITYTISGLTPGDAYICQITSIDIYTESNVVTATLVMPVVNTLKIYTNTIVGNSITFDLDYSLDSGFSSGNLYYWLSTQDPSIDQPQGGFSFNNGATTVTASGLTADTTYKFKATIVLGDGVNTVNSSVVTATMDDTDYFYVENLENTESFYIRKVGSPTTGSDIKYSLDKNTWLTPQYTNGFAYIPVQGTAKIYFRSSTGFSQSSSSYYIINTHTGESFKAGGNILTLIDYTNIDTTTAVPNYGFYHMFASSGITEANVFGELVSIGDHSCYGMFSNSKITNVGNPQKIKTVRNYGCSNMFSRSDLLNPLNLNTVTSAYPYAFESMYSDCGYLISASNLNGLQEINPYTCSSMYSGCTSLVNPPEMENVIVIRNDGLAQAFYGCSSLISGINLKNVTSVDFNSGNTTYGIMGSCYFSCTSLKTAYAPNITNLNQNNNMVLKNWLFNVTTGGTAYKKSGASFLSGADGLPSGWTSRNY